MPKSAKTIGSFKRDEKNDVKFDWSYDEWKNFDVQVLYTTEKFHDTNRKIRTWSMSPFIDESVTKDLKKYYNLNILNIKIIGHNISEQARNFGSTNVFHGVKLDYNKAINGSHKIKNMTETRDQLINSIRKRVNEINGQPTHNNRLLRPPLIIIR